MKSCLLQRLQILLNITGSLSSYESESDSGTVRSRTFCPKCGTRIYAKTVGERTEGGIGFVGPASWFGGLA